MVISHNKTNNICTKILNKTNKQTKSLKVKNDTFNETEGVFGLAMNSKKNYEYLHLLFN
jgi:hypothetical protein